MSIQNAYDQWASQYDTNKNRTRDLEGQVLREMLSDVPFERVLEIGCGTGKNTAWLLDKAQHVTAVDLSEDMLAKAKEKISSSRVRFIQADITQEWTFADKPYDLITFSLVLEHISRLEDVFAKVCHVLQPGGYVYVGELHPFKQYMGTKARFDTAAGRLELECYTHHMTDFVQAARSSGFELLDLQEFFDEGDKTSVPRILALVFRKPVDS